MTQFADTKTESNAKQLEAQSAVSGDSFQDCLQRAKDFVAQELWDEAILSYQQAIALQPAKQAWIYLALGSLLVKKDRVDDAIECYKTAHSLKPENARTFALMGVALEKKQERDRSIASYKKAVTLDPEQPSWVHNNLGNALSDRALDDYKEAAFRYAQVMCRRDRFSHFDLLNEMLTKVFGLFGQCTEKSMRLLFQDFAERDPRTFCFLMRLAKFGFLSPKGKMVNPAGYYIVNEQLKTVYCSIPKNACTLFKTMMIEHSELKNVFESSDENIHQYLNRQVKVMSAWHLLDCLDSDEYFKFVVLRNPFERVVSGYLDKFAKHVVPEAFVQEIILAVQASLRVEPNIEKSITFSQFVDYLADTPDGLLNDHWRPQCGFTASVSFNMAGQFERIDQVVSDLEKRLNIHVRKDISSHITRYKLFNDGSQFHDMYPYELRALSGGMPVASNLFLDKLKWKFEQRYQQDIQFYKQSSKMAT